MHMQKGLFLSIELCMIQVVNFLGNCLLVELWGILFSSTPSGGKNKRLAGDN